MSKRSDGDIGIIVLWRREEEKKRFKL